ncbi:hypothetical protein BOX15_Mlig016788g1 [Macrostomum lignano]|uniref:DMAP1-binding domain-containing protein n=1 Tax=Macrostomum lignano TaxID=282301 RepID=A0A267GUX8_9PLAT|nr:hypothetical protein BOX15_Mlig016788g1 [Macrostomum lignano]
MKQQSLNMSAEIDTSRLPLDVRAKLAELELELSDGDITQKGYEKKRAKLLDPYMGRQQPPNTQAQSQPQAQSQSRPKDASPDDSSGGSPRIRRPRHHRRDDLRYQSDIRTEAVQAALAKHRESAGPSTGGGAGNHSGSSSTAMPLAAVRRQPSSAMTQSTMGAAAFASADREHYSEEDASAGSGSDLGDDDDKEVAVDDRHPADGEHSTLDDASVESSLASSSVGGAGGGGGAGHSLAKSAASVSSVGGSSSSSGKQQHQLRQHQQSEPVQPQPPASSAAAAASSTNQSSRSRYSSSDTYIIKGNNYLGMPTNQSRPAGGSGDSSQQLQRRHIQQPPAVQSQTPPMQRQQQRPPNPQQQQQQSSRQQPPDVTLAASAAAAAASAEPQPSAASDHRSGPYGQSRTSAKIQQLVATLARPKQRQPTAAGGSTSAAAGGSSAAASAPDAADVTLTSSDSPDSGGVDANAPRPQGEESRPAVGESLITGPGAAASLEESLMRAAAGPQARTQAVACLELSGKLSSCLTFAKLLNRSKKLAYTLLNRLGHRGDSSLKPGDRVAIAVPNSDPVSFVIAFLASQFAGLVPVPVEAPPLCASATGFLLSSLDIRVLLTTEAFIRTAPKAVAAAASASGSTGTSASGGGSDQLTYPGWPRSLFWALVDANQSNPPKDWQPPSLQSGGLDPASLAYVEYAWGRDGSVRGVCVSRGAALAHTRSIGAACGYASGESLVCLVDPKRELGLWHAVLAAAYYGMSVVFVPYAVMKQDPSCWLRLVSKQRIGVALAKSRDLYWSLLTQRDHREVNLNSLRCLLVADGANPWSLTSCDSFLSVFQPRGLRPEALCPCAYSCESLTVALRRPAGSGAATSGRGVLSMQGLSHGVVRVDSENSYTSLTLQDCGLVMPAGAVAVVRLAPAQPFLCRQDEVGEICVSARYAAHKYWGLAGLSNQVFRCQPLTAATGAPISDREVFVRTGLLGFLGPPSSGGLVFVCGSLEGLMTVAGRRHNSDDLIATVLAVEPLKFVFRGRIAVFSQRILNDERIIIAAEQRPDANEDQCFQWMSHVLQAVDSIHQVGVYCIALVPPNSLPRSPLGGINSHETRRRFAAGQLHPANILMCPHSTVTNLPKPRQTTSAEPLSMMVGSLVQGARLAEAEGRPMPDDGLQQQQGGGGGGWMSLADTLRARSRDPDQRLFTVLSAGKLVGPQAAQPEQCLTALGLHKRAERLAALLRSRLPQSLSTDQQQQHAVALMLPPGLDLIVGVFGCFYAGCLPVAMRPPPSSSSAAASSSSSLSGSSTVGSGNQTIGHQGLPACQAVLQASKASLLLTNQPTAKLLKALLSHHQQAANSWPPVVDIDDKRKVQHQQQQPAPAHPDSDAYLDFSISTTGLLSGVRVTHRAAVHLCKAVKLQCELYPTREIALCLDPYSGLSFALWCLCSVYTGHHTVLLPPAELEASPAAFLFAVSQRGIRDAFCSYPVLDLCASQLAQQLDLLKQKLQVSLSSLRSLIAVAEERPRLGLLQSFSKLFSPLGLKASALSASFGCRVNACICLQGASSPECSTVYVDAAALRQDRVQLVDRGSPGSLPLSECGQLLCGTRVVIANPETRTQCADSHLGEIWVAAGHSASGYCALLGSGFGGGDTDTSGAVDPASARDHFNACLTAGGDTSVRYCRTGYLGFVKRTDLTAVDGSRHDAVFLVGALDEAIQLRGLRYHPGDIEATVVRCHHTVCECAVFTWRSLLVVVAELNGKEFESLDLIPLITSSILEEHHLIAGVIVICDPRTIPLNSRGEKQRMHLRDGFLDDKLDPIYVAYNL